MCHKNVCDSFFFASLERMCFPLNPQVHIFLYQKAPDVFKHCPLALLHLPAARNFSRPLNFAIIKQYGFNNPQHFFIASPSTWCPLCLPTHLLPIGIYWQHFLNTFTTTTNTSCKSFHKFFYIILPKIPPIVRAKKEGKCPCVL